MEFNRTQVKVTIYGEAHTLRLPTFQQSREYRKQFLACEKDEEKQTDCLLEFLDKVVGLKRSVSDQMEPEHLESLVEMLLSKKKPTKPTTS